MANVVLGTWNVSECVNACWDVNTGIDSNPSFDVLMNNCDEIIKLINENGIDVICFQEFPTVVEDSEEITQKIIQNTKLKYHYSVDTYPTFLVKNGRAGVAIFSSTELISKKFSFMENPDIRKLSKNGKVYYSFDKGLITADLLIEGQPLTVVTGHAFSFSPFGALAEDYPSAFKEISNCAFDALTKNENVVVVGDFNTEKLFEILPELNDDFKDNLSGPTTVSGVMEGENFKSGRKLDYFLTAPSVRVGKTTKIKNFSDHCLCICECSF